MRNIWLSSSGDDQMSTRREQSGTSSRRIADGGRVSGYLRVADVGDDLGVSARTVLRWIDRGEIDALRLPDGRLRTSQTAYSTWLAAHTMRAGGRTLVTVEKEA
jgi:excisionase family DNA binding protein